MNESGFEFLKLTNKNKKFAKRDILIDRTEIFCKILVFTGRQVAGVFFVKFMHARRGDCIKRDYLWNELDQYDLHLVTAIQQHKYNNCKTSGSLEVMNNLQHDLF